MATRKTPTARKSPTARRPGPVAGAAKNPTVALRALDLDVVLRDYGFGVTVSVLAVDRATGFVVDGLDAANFLVTAVQSPSGWAHEHALTISSGIFNSAGVHQFSVERQGKKLADGPWTLKVAVRGAHGGKQLVGAALAAIVV
jgi:hypothetical protein